ncbi:hypothetical protein S83_041016 [Arachis hypogaea]
MLDRNPRLNLASFLTTWMDPECEKLMMAAINKNHVDMDKGVRECKNGATSRVGRELSVASDPPAGSTSKGPNDDGASPNLHRFIFVAPVAPLGL